VFTTNLAYFYDDIVADHFQIKIVLPEGVQDVKVNNPVEMDDETFYNSHQYLDMKEGRTVLELSRRNVHPTFHNQEISISYQLPFYNMVWKPTLLMIYAFFLFVFVSVYIRDPRFGSQATVDM